MGRPKTNEQWEEAIRKLTENEPRLGPLAIRKRIEEAGEKTGYTGTFPGLRTIGRLQQRFRALPDKERLRYRQLRWPEDMADGLLPWEAGPAALELLRWRRERGIGPPLIGQVRWFWRVSAVAPGAPFDERYTAARLLCALDVAGDAHGEDLRRSIELWAAFAPWQSEKDAEAYHAALAGAPAFPHGADFTIAAGTEAGDMGKIMAALDGVGISETAHRAVAELIQQRMSEGEPQ